MAQKNTVGRGQYGMVSTASPEATQAGVRMLEKGGNAVDAAVAAAFCLGVTEPQASGLGGQSMALVYLAETEKIFALDGSSRAPYGLSPYVSPIEPLRLGITATTVPSTPAVLGYMLDHYGSLTLRDILEPSIIAAEEGYRISALQHRLLTREIQKLLEDPCASEVFFKQGRPPHAGEQVRQSQLAKTLAILSEKGWQDFYLGEIGEGIIRDMINRGGLLSRADLSQIPYPVERPPLASDYRGKKLATFPPPGAGRALIKILNVLENFAPEELELQKPSANLIMALVFRAALRTREKNPVDPDLFLQQPNKIMLDKGYAKEIASRLKRYLAHIKMEEAAPKVSGETTHLSVVDHLGNMVGITQSIELVFGSKTTAAGLGFFYNNYMSAFEYRDMTHPYFLLPGAIPWSSVAPTILYDEDGSEVMLGSPGSERISTSLAQVISRMVDGGQDLGTAIDAPRLHASSGSRVQIETKRFSEETMAMLNLAGFDITNRGKYSFYLGCVQAVMRDAKGQYIGVADPRRDGTAMGPAIIGR